jgi:hypothetical protein
MDVCRGHDRGAGGCGILRRPCYELGPTEVVQLLTNDEGFRMCDGPPCLREPPLGRCSVEVADVAPDLAARQPKPVARNLSRPPSGPELACSGWEPVVVAVADVREVHKVEPGGFGDDPRGFWIMGMSRISNHHGSSSTTA